MPGDYGLLILRVRGLGCAGCVAPSKEHFLRAPGVEGVNVLGSKVYVLYRTWEASPGEVISGSKVTEYYEVEIEEAITGSREELVVLLNPSLPLALGGKARSPTRAS